jgi:hypothetical protein
LRLALPLFPLCVIFLFFASATSVRWKVRTWLCTM